MDNYCISFKVGSSSESELLMAYLEDYPFYSFEEEPDQLKAYIKAKNWTAETKAAIETLSLPFPVQFEETFLPYKNWNAVWEANFQPIEVPGFCGIRARFHPSFQNVQHEILIDPEMAFGTGHHATTFMVIEMMQRLPFAGKKVFDYGCGTGILAILASKMGAEEIDAVDIEQPAYENTIKNAQLNQVENINAIHGTLLDVNGQHYQIILANINRNVILDSLDALYEKAAAGAHILFSGILHTDLEEVKQAAENSGFQYQNHQVKGGWIAMYMKKA